MEALHIKAIHIIMVVSWFAGLLYIVRLFIYHVEANDKEEPEKSILQNQFKIMEKRLWYYITWPAAILTIFSGFYLVYLYNYWLQPWMHLKFAFVFGLFLYQLKCQQIYDQLKNDVFKWGSTKLRLWNEVATLLLVAIVFIVVVGKVSLDQWYWGVLGLLIVAILMMLVVKLYKKSREKKG